MLSSSPPSAPVASPLTGVAAESSPPSCSPASSIEVWALGEGHRHPAPDLLLREGVAVHGKGTPPSLFLWLGDAECFLHVLVAAGPSLLGNRLHYPLPVLAPVLLPKQRHHHVWVSGVADSLGLHELQERVVHREGLDLRLVQEEELDRGVCDYRAPGLAVLGVSDARLAEDARPLQGGDVGHLQLQHGHGLCVRALARGPPKTATQVLYLVLLRGVLDERL
mmetsp:Transcript_26324/g.58270  ORF Transcript_26324/g.58270 Transcript_26324/m.58270 type:complete len:222 (-) Transcript_26324:629-1294(-)